MARARHWILTSLLLIGACAEVIQDPPPPEGDSGVCTPSCGARVCGDDGCGGSCGTCMGEEFCNAGMCTTGPPPCLPSCGAAVCGDNGCGGSCGLCPAGQSCVAGACSDGPCTPDCAGRVCGTDGCSGNCGTCDSGFSCNATGACDCTAPLTCLPDMDMDGYPVATGAMTACNTCPAGFIPMRADSAVDCQDGNADVNPGADWTEGQYCSRPAGGLCSMSSSDWNCDGTAEARWTNRGGCVLIGGSCTTTEGWFNAVPFGCVGINTYITGCDGSCMPITDNRAPQCR